MTTRTPEAYRAMADDYLAQRDVLRFERQRAMERGDTITGEGCTHAIDVMSAAADLMRALADQADERQEGAST